MPKRLLVIGGLFCLVGGAALVGMMLDLVRDRFLDINLAAFMLPVGLGLTSARRSSRRWATAWAGLTLCVVIASAATLAFSDVGSAQAHAFGLALTGLSAMRYLVILHAALATTCVFVIWTLYTKPVSIMFGADGAPPPATSIDADRPN